MYVFSLSSCRHGGFLRGVPCKVVSTVGNISIIEVERNINGTNKLDTAYEVYNEQLFEKLPEPYIMYQANTANVVSFPEGTPLSSYKMTINHPVQYDKGDKVWVYQRQLWGGKYLPHKTKATIKQKQLGPSVLLDIEGFDHSIEVYDVQVEKRRTVLSLYNK